jgi:hypothetical protein
VAADRHFRGVQLIALLLIAHFAVSIKIGILDVVALTAKEARLLAFFLERPRRALSRDTILNAVWGSSVFVTPRSIESLRHYTSRKTRDLSPESGSHLDITNCTERQLFQLICTIRNGRVGSTSQETIVQLAQQF